MNTSASKVWPFLKGAIWMFSVMFAVLNMNTIDAYFRTHDTLSAATKPIMLAIVVVAVVTMLVFAFSIIRTAGNRARWSTHGASTIGMVTGFILGVGPTTFMNTVLEKLQ